MRGTESRLENDDDDDNNSNSKSNVYIYTYILYMYEINHARSHIEVVRLLLLLQRKIYIFAVLTARQRRPLFYFSLLGCFARLRLDPAWGSARAIIIARVGGAM